MTSSVPSISGVKELVASIVCGRECESLPLLLPRRGISEKRLEFRFSLLFDSKLLRENPKDRRDSFDFLGDGSAVFMGRMLLGGNARFFVGVAGIPFACSWVNAQSPPWPGSHNCSPCCCSALRILLFELDLPKSLPPKLLRALLRFGF